MGEGRVWGAGGGLTLTKALFQLGPGMGRTRTQLWPVAGCPGPAARWSGAQGEVKWDGCGGDQGTVESRHHERRQSHVPGGGDKGLSGDSGLNENPRLMPAGPTDGQTGEQLHPRELLLEPSRTLYPSFP